MYYQIVGDLINEVVVGFYNLKVVGILFSLFVTRLGCVPMVIVFNLIISNDAQSLIRHCNES